MPARELRHSRELPKITYVDSQQTAHNLLWLILLDLRLVLDTDLRRKTAPQNRSRNGGLLVEICQFSSFRPYAHYLLRDLL
jgi:hypothetical protein